MAPDGPPQARLTERRVHQRARSFVTQPVRSYRSQVLIFPEA
jgi:hypothetical protein